MCKKCILSGEWSLRSVRESCGCIGSLSSRYSTSPESPESSRLHHFNATLSLWWLLRKHHWLTSMFLLEYFSLNSPPSGTTVNAYGQSSSFGSIPYAWRMNWPGWFPRTRPNISIKFNTPWVSFYYITELQWLVEAYRASVHSLYAGIVEVLALPYYVGNEGYDWLFFVSWKQL